MRKIIVSEFVTLDGVMEDPGGAEKTEHGGWSMKYWGDDIANFKLDELVNSDSLLLGRSTYQRFAAAWPKMRDEAGYADRMNGYTKYVVSTTLGTAEWNNSRIINGNLKEEIMTLKEQPGKDILVFGSRKLVQELFKLGLIDEFQLLVYPVVLGSGKRLFEGKFVGLKLVETKGYKSGVVLLRYQAE